MNAITLSQPWASLVATGKVRAHAMPFPTEELGVYAIVAARSFNRQQIATALGPNFLRWIAETGITTLADIPRGAVVGVVDLCGVSVIDAGPVKLEGEDFVVTRDGPISLVAENAAFGDWIPGRYAWKFESCIALAEPIPCRGARGVRALPADVEALVRSQILQEA